MDDKELVEVWRADFIGLIPCCVTSAINDDGTFYSSNTEVFWQGFLLAKRSQPSFVLPRQINCRGIYFDLEGYDAEEMRAAITAAGIKYTVKG